MTRVALERSRGRDEGVRTKGEEAGAGGGVSAGSSGQKSDTHLVDRGCLCRRIRAVGRVPVPVPSRRGCPPSPVMDGGTLSTFRRRGGEGGVGGECMLVE